MLTTDEIVKQVYTEVYDLLVDGIQPVDDFISLCGIIMSLIQNHRELAKHGGLKKKILLIIFNDLLGKSGLFDDDQLILLSNFIESTLSPLSDALKTLARTIYSSKKLVLSW